MSSQPQGFKAWRVIEKTPESAVITSFVLAPQGGPAPMDFRPGQFLGAAGVGRRHSSAA
jgi:ferredoxin-NADP reductase